MRRLPSAGNISEMALSPRKDAEKKRNSIPMSVQIRLERERLFAARTKSKRIRVGGSSDNILP